MWGRFTVIVVSHPKRSSNSGLNREPIDVAAGRRVFNVSLSADGLAVTSVMRPRGATRDECNGLLLVLHPAED